MHPAAEGDVLMTTVVLTASKHGSTREIAARLEQVLQRSGEPVLVESIEHSATRLPESTRMVVGIPVYMQKLLPAGVSFLEEHAASVEGRELFIFVSGGSPHLDEKLRNDLQQFTPHQVAYFRGSINASKLNLAEKALLKVVKSPLNGDWRDWDAIDDWARKLVD